DCFSACCMRGSGLRWKRKTSFWRATNSIMLLRCTLTSDCSSSADNHAHAPESSSTYSLSCQFTGNQYTFGRAASCEPKKNSTEWLASNGIRLLTSATYAALLASTSLAGGQTLRENGYGPYHSSPSRLASGSALMATSMNRTPKRRCKRAAASIRAT